jgi:hypothetical protein
MNATSDSLAKSLAFALNEARNRGFAAPIQVIVVGVNGTLLAGRYADGGQGELEFVQTVEHFPEYQGFQIPLNIFLVNAFGDSCRVLVKDDKYLVN